MGTVYHKCFNVQLHFHTAKCDERLDRFEKKRYDDLRDKPSSSSGLGRCPLTAVTGVRLPYWVPGYKNRASKI